MDKRSLIGHTIGKYKIVESLGRGGMAEVYRAYQENLDRYVAVKLMHSFLADEENFLTRFQREAKAMASLNHSHIVGVYDFDIQEGIYYIVMEFVSGGTLKSKMESLAKSGEQLPLDEAIRTILEIADALAYAHGKGMVHRDIKPGNIMLTDDGSAVLTDFGIAKILSGPSFTATGAMIGTPAYMSPEQGLGRPGDERSDLYALGVLFYQMVTGQLPYDADTPLAVILKHVNDPLPLPHDQIPDLPGPVEQVILKAMAKDPADRFQSASSMARELYAAAGQSNLDMTTGFVFEYVSETPTPPPPRPGQADATVLSSQPGLAPVPDATRIASTGAMGHTEIAAPIVPPAPTPTQAPVPIEQPRQGRRWGFVIGAFLLMVLGAAAAGAFFISQSDGEPADRPTATVEVIADVTDLPPTETPEPVDTVDIGATAASVAVQTLQAQRTDTPEPTNTSEPTPTPTPDATATFIASCTREVELVNSYTFQNPATSSVAVGSSFPMKWVIRNSGTCPMPTDLQWNFIDGEDFDQTGPESLDEELQPGEETTIEAALRAPSSTGTYETTWGFMDAEGNAFGAPQEAEVFVIILATATPEVSPTPTVAPTAIVSGPFGYNWNVGGCSYDGGNWQCFFDIIPFGGSGDYSFTTDEDPAPSFTGPGPFTFTITSPRCFAWVHTLTITDNGTGQVIREPQFVDPNAHFPGGCTTI